jgi:carbon storage regulator CsrA
MLVLERKQGQKILIGDDVVIVVCRVPRTGAVKLGIKAPGKRIVRTEISEELTALADYVLTLGR